MTLCRVLRVNRSTYYKFVAAQPSNHELENRNIRIRIAELHGKYNKRLGARKMKKCLERECCIFISVGRVYRLMKSMNLPRMSSEKPFKPMAKNTDDNCENRLNKQFSVSAANTVWCGDITYIRAGGRFCYLAVVIDLFGRKVVGWRLSSKADSGLVCAAFEKAYAFRGRPKGLLFHSDRGAQYTSKAFRSLLENYEVIQSFSAKGHPYDNAVCESFFKYLKKEETNRKTYFSMQELELSLFAYIEGFYNNARPHSANNGLAPNEFERNI